MLAGAAFAGAAAAVLGGVPVADAGLSGTAEGFGAGFAVDGITRFGFCLSGNTRGPFWPHAISIAAKLTIVNRRTPFMGQVYPPWQPGLAGTSMPPLWSE